MEKYRIQETSVWGDAYRAMTPEEVLRCGKKRELLQTASHLFIDHYRIYALKPRGQRGPVRESQTFIVSHVYVYDEFIGTREAEFISQLSSIGLRFYKEPCLFRGKNAYTILIMDLDVDVEKVLPLLPGER